MSLENDAQLIAKEMEREGIAIDEKEAHTFALYLSELKRWNSKYNLIGLRDDIQIIRRLFVSSATFLRLIRKYPSVSVIDIGSGGGFPGIPLKILRPELNVACVDSNKKKVLFLKHVSRILSIDVLAKAERAEDIIVAGGEKYDYAVAHSVGTIGLLIELSFPLLKEGGKLLMRKGDELEDELREIALFPEKHLIQERVVVFPEEEEGYTLISIKKCST